MATSNKNFKVKNGLDVSGTATASSFVKTGGTSAEFLMADGSVSAGSGGGGSLEVSETPPSSPSEGDIWYNSQTGQTFVYYDSFWVENIAGIAGPEGPTGPAGPTGPTGDTGVVISETTPESTDVLWLDSDAVAEVPVPIGGTTGQVLAKSSNDDYDTEWANLPAEVIPTGGTTGQILTKDSEDNYDISWQDLPESSGVVTSATPPENTNSIWFNTETGLTYIYYDSYWTSISGNSGTPIISDTAPTSPVLGMQWFNSSTGKSYIYYSNAWVEIDSNGTSTASTGNAIINGAFDIWQRGSTFNNIAGGAYFADRWLMGFKDAGLTLNVSRQSFTPGSAPVAGVEGEFFARFATTAFSTNNTYYFGQKIEDVRTFAGQTVTLSYWARVSSGTLTPSRLFLNQQFGSGGSAEVDNIGNHTPTYTTTWQRFTQTIAVPSISGKTVGTSSNLWLLWQMTPNANVSLDIWGVQLEAGTVATPFRRNAPSIAAELAACQRYYFRLTNPVSSTFPITALTYYSATVAYGTIKTPVTMRRSPTAIEISSVGQFFTMSAGAQRFASALSLYGLDSVDLIGLAVTTVGATAGHGAWLETSTANAFLGFSAEL